MMYLTRDEKSEVRKRPQGSTLHLPNVHQCTDHTKMLGGSTYDTQARPHSHRRPSDLKNGAHLLKSRKRGKNNNTPFGLSAVVANQLATATSRFKTSTVAVRTIRNVKNIVSN